jgi:hypothetical protein
MGTQSRFHVPDRDAAIEGRESCYHDGRRIALHQDQVKFACFEEGVKLGKNPAAQPRERLVRDHDVKILVHPDIKEREDLMDHLAVLAGADYDGFGPILLLERPDDRSHFDAFRPRPDKA